MITQIRGAVILLLLFAVGLAAPGYAVAEPGAKLYELTENMSLKGKNNVFRRATSELAGFAKLGTPLCPEELVKQFNPDATFCFLNATGSDNISLQTGVGTFNGTFTVVVQGDNAVDSPELVVARGNFDGLMDFSPAILRMTPFGTVKGHLTLDGGNATPFTGIFRLPFVVPLVLEADLRACLAGSNPETCLSPALYLNDDGSTALVREDEKALGYPTVRFEISF